MSLKRKKSNLLSSNTHLYLPDIDLPSTPISTPTYVAACFMEVDPLTDIAVGTKFIVADDIAPKIISRLMADATEELVLRHICDNLI